MLYQLSSFDSPESLYDQCLHFLVDNWKECLTVKKTSSENVEITKNLVLPTQVCEGFFELYLRKNKVLKNDFLDVFKNPKFARLKKVKIRDDCYYTFSAKDFISILHPDLQELHIQNQHLTDNMELLEYLNNNSNNLKTFSCNKKFFSSAFKTNKTENDDVPVIINEIISYAFQDWDHLLNIPNLEKLALNGFPNTPPAFFDKMILPLKNLAHLDITDCFQTIDYSFLTELKQLKSLILHNVMVTEEGFKIIKKLPNLEHLDLSFSGNSGIYRKPELLYFMIKGVPSLTSLDISKTNLDFDIGEVLKLRKNELQYLGLYKTYNNACREGNLLAKRISGDANIKQLFNAGYAHFERFVLMKRLLNDFIDGFDSFIEYDLILKFVLKILDRHPYLAGDCQALFKRYLTSWISLTPKVKNHLICSTMNMAIIDNAEIDIELFSKWTADDWFRNEKIVMSFINHLIDKSLDKEWAQKILYHILNIINESQRELFAIYGVMKTLATAIANIRVPYYFEWDFTWRCIRKNLVNSRAFIENHNMDSFTEEMDYFMKYSPEDKEVMERQLIVYFSLAQYECLNEYLMQKGFKFKEGSRGFKILVESCFIWILSELLEKDLPQSPFRPNNGPRVNYFAGCILLKLLTYESCRTAIEKLKREEILKNILVNLEKWSPDRISHCYLEEELFELILDLFRVENFPQCKYWAVWGIFHFSYDVQEKYFSSEREEAIRLIKSIVETEFAPCSVRKISKMLLERWEGDS